MIINEMTGYMLSGGGAHRSGEKWWPYNTNVYVCMSLEKAKELMAMSHKEPLTHGTVWTTIYRVSAQNIDCQKFGDGLMWTNQPTKIIVDGPVYYHAPNKMSEGELLKNARRILPQYSHLMNQMNKEENIR
ncbi:MAG: hypothetical protein IJ500_00690 [Alphaproteobacteria bacterium]|nr:hypothetical protein [Alphaproteobacteria bacterium]